MIDLMQFLDMGIIGVIIGIMEIIKAADQNRKLARWYPLMVLLLGVLAGFLRAPSMGWRDLGYNILMYGGGASIIFKFGKTTIMGK